MFLSKSAIFQDKKNSFFYFAVSTFLEKLFAEKLEFSKTNLKNPTEYFQRFSECSELSHEFDFKIQHSTILSGTVLIVTDYSSKISGC